jgi:hypothetical protein
MRYQNRIIYQTTLLGKNFRKIFSLVKMHRKSIEHGSIYIRQVKQIVFQNNLYKQHVLLNTINSLFYIT